MTMSISSAPLATASLTSASLTARLARPLGNAVATAATWMPVPTERLAGHAGEVAVDADGGDRRAGRVARVGAACALAASAADLAGGVGSLQRREVDHRDREVDGPGLRRRLDRAGAEHGGARLGADLVDAGQAVQEGAERRVRAGDVVVRRQRGASNRARHRAARRGRARGSCRSLSPARRPPVDACVPPSGAVAATRALVLPHHRVRLSGGGGEPAAQCLEVGPHLRPHVAVVRGGAPYSARIGRNGSDVIS